MPKTEEIVRVGITSLLAVLLLTSLVTAVFLIWSFSFLFIISGGFVFVIDSKVAEKPAEKKKIIPTRRLCVPTRRLAFLTTKIVAVKQCKLMAYSDLREGELALCQ